MFKSIFKKIIDITGQESSHLKIILFGFVKISILNFSMRKRFFAVNETFKYYKNNNLDISSYPQATGILREIQLAQVELLKEFDYVCKTANLDYWIDFGTLIGAVRHKGFIPWDDDTDVSMPREFYNQLIEKFNSLTRNKNMEAGFFRKGNSVNNYFIRVKYKNSPVLLDVFPCDFYGENLTQEEKIKRSSYIKEQREKTINKFVLRKKPKDELMKEQIVLFRNKILVNGEHKKDSKTDIVWGVDFYHLWKQWFHSYDTIYPLKQIEYEGVLLNCPNDYDTYLRSIYGNYMGYPKDVKHSHTIYRLTEKQLQQLKKEMNKD